MANRKTVMLLGASRGMLDYLRVKIDMPGWRVLQGTDVQAVSDALIDGGLDALVVGPGVTLDMRVQCVKLIFTLSRHTAVHLSDLDTGAEQMAGFVQRMLGQAEAV